MHQRLAFSSKLGLRYCGKNEGGEEPILGDVRLRGEEWPGLMIEWLQQLGELYTKINIMNDEVVIDVAAGAGSQCMGWILGGESLYGWPFRATRDGKGVKHLRI